MSFILAIAFALSLVVAAPITADAKETIYAAPLKDSDQKTVDYLLSKDLTNKIVILHTTDVHGALIKLANVATLKKKLEAKGADVLLIDGGDFSFAKWHKDKPEAPEEYEYLNDSHGLGAITVMNALGYDYATIGNHEYEFGAKDLKDNLELANFKTMSGNIKSSDSKRSDKLMYSPYYVYQNNENGIKIGLFGLTSIETRGQKNLKGTEIIGEANVNNEANFHNPMFDIANAQVEALKSEGADTIIAVTHLGVKLKDERKKYLTTNRSIDMYNNIKLNEDGTNPIDLILDGHSHNSLVAGEKGEPIMSGGIRLDNLGVVILDNQDKNDPIKERFLISLADLERGAKADPEITELVGLISDNKIDLEGFTRAQHEAFLRGETVPVLPENKISGKSANPNDNKKSTKPTKNRNSKRNHR